MTWWKRAFDIKPEYHEWELVEVGCYGERHCKHTSPKFVDEFEHRSYIWERNKQNYHRTWIIIKRPAPDGSFPFEERVEEYWTMDKDTKEWTNTLKSGDDIFFETNCGTKE